MRLIWLVPFVVACGSSNGTKTIDSANGSADGSVDTPGGNPTTITVTLQDHPATAATYSFLAAYQDGASAWQLAPAPSGDVYTFTVTAPVWAFAWTCVPANTGTNRVELAYFATAEKTSLTETIPRECSDAYPTDATLSGTVTNMPSGSSGYVALYEGRRTDVSKTATAGSFPGAASQFRVPPGSHDLVIAHVSLATGTASIPDLAIARSITAPATTAPIVNYSMSATLPSYAVTLGSVTGQVVVATTVYTAGGTTVPLVAEDGTAASFTTESLASAQAVSGDIYDQSITISNNGATSLVDNWTTTVAAQTYVAPAALGGATSSVTAATPYPEIKTTWNAYPSATGYSWSARQGGTAAAPTLRWRAIAGPGYLGANPVLQMPDLSMLAGWSNTSWAFQAGTVVNGNTAALTSSGGAGDFPPVVPATAPVQRAAVAADWSVTP